MSAPDAPPPALVVHSLAHARAALASAADRACAVVLLSAPGAGVFAGPGWFNGIVGLAREAVPAARFEAILDCGDDAGAAMAAIRADVGAVIFTGRADVAERLAAIAAAAGGRLLAARPPALLDLGDLMFADAEALRRRVAAALAAGSA